MVKQAGKPGNILYQCEECGFNYKEKSWAEKCEDWCSKHKSCNIDVTKHSVQ